MTKNKESIAEEYRIRSKALYRKAKIIWIVGMVGLIIALINHEFLNIEWIGTIGKGIFLVALIAGAIFHVWLWILEAKIRRLQLR